MPDVPSFGAPYAPSEIDLPDRIGPYRVVRLLATGRTSEILLAREEGPHGFERVVVLKTLLPRLRDDPRFARMFVREACAYTRVSHPAVGRLLRLVDDRGELALVLEYIDGLPLHQLRAELHRSGERLRDEASLFLAFRLFSALAATHAARDPLSGEFSPVVHADVNPSNIVVPWDGYAKLVDFGSARVSGAGSDAPTGPSPRAYLAPEQARGEPFAVRADLYSACLIVWELLSGRRAIVQGRDSYGDLLKAMTYLNLPSLALLRPDLPKAIHDLIARGLRPNPDHRDLVAEDACDVLRAVTDLNRARGGLVEALSGLRFASVEEERLRTTPNLPAYATTAAPSEPALYVQHASDRPVVLPELGAPRAPRVRSWWASPWAAGAGLSLAMACGAGLLVAIVRRSDPPLGATPRTPVAAPKAPSAPPPPAPLPAAALLPAPLPPAPLPPAPLPPDHASAVPPAPVAVFVTPSPSPVPRSPAPSLQRATVTVPVERAGHRVWIDGRLVGQSPGTFDVRCGSHAVRVGSQGPLQRLDVGCGADIVVR